MLHSAYANDRVYLDVEKFKNTGLLIGVKKENKIDDATLNKWVRNAIEDRDFNNAIAVLQKIDKKFDKQNSKKTNALVKEAMDSLSIAAKSRYEGVSIISAHAGIFIDSTYYSNSTEKLRPHILEFLKVYQDAHICSGYYREAELITSKIFRSYRDYPRAIELLDKSKSFCTKKALDRWEYRKYIVTKMLLKARYKEIKRLRGKNAKNHH